MNHHHHKIGHIWAKYYFARINFPLWIAVSLFLLSISYLILNLKYPEYGGDEVWFATTLLYKKISGLSLFEFWYAGPIKTFLTFFVFDLFGFNIYSVRLFSVGIYILTVSCWSVYLAKNKLWVALASSLIIFALNADLLFFAKVDINQPTFHNLFFIFHLIVFLTILKHGPTITNSLLFLLLALVESNLHIRNIWIMNSFLFAFLLDYILFVNSGKITKKAIILFFSRGWAVLAGWFFSVSYFLYVIIHFRNNPLLMQAKAHGDQTTYIKSILRSFHNLFEYIMGSRVFAQAYSNQFQQDIILIIGAIFCVFTIIFFIVIYKRRNSITNSNFFRISGAVITITIAIFVQYAITKSAIKPWHGNHVLLLWVIIIGLLLEGLFLARQKIISYIFLISISVACIAVQLLMANQSKIINLNRRGFQLVVWQPYSLKPIRQYIHNHPGTYIIADWEIGRPLALENHYSSSNNQAVKSWLAPFKEQYITDLSDRMVIRATNITQTVPDWSDETMARFDAKFECIEKFKDEFGRTMYEIGYIRKNE